MYLMVISLICEKSLLLNVISYVTEKLMQVNSKVILNIILIPELHTLISLQIFIHVGIFYVCVPVVLAVCS